jgi:RNA polymerase sigma-70 factor (ECF subfamily)
LIERNDKKDESDSDLVQRFKEGEERAFNQLVLRYQKRIHDLVYRMVRNQEDAADISMEVFVRAYKGLGSFEERSSFHTWVTKIAVNLCINFAKREKFRSFLSIFDLSEEPSTANSSADQAERKALSVAIDQAIKSLPPRQRSCFVLKFYQGLSHKETAEILGISEGAVKANYFQAVQKLQKLLAPYRGEFTG